MINESLPNLFTNSATQAIHCFLSYFNTRFWLLYNDFLDDIFFQSIKSSQIEMKLPTKVLALIIKNNTLNWEKYI